MTSPRVGHTATLLNNGKVLVAGGYNGTTVVASAELYDPATGNFTATGSMTSPRSVPTATLLNNGKVLVAGGDNGTSRVASAELYDPATGTFTATGSMTSPRSGHTATLLNNGKVLVAGGYNGTTEVASAELYDPATGTFAATGGMSTARSVHTATFLNNGMVLVAGGFLLGGRCSSPLANAELYDPATGTFTATGSMIIARGSHTATFLKNGTVLLAGGQAPAPCSASAVVASAELYDPATGTFTATGSMSSPRASHTATLLNNGKVLVAGGNSGTTVFASAELYDPATGTFTATGSMSSARRSHTATLLNIGNVLVAGGFGSNILASAELYVPAVVFPASLSFSNQVAGTTSASQSVTVTNYQSMALSITSIAIGGTNGSDFAQSNTCGTSLPAGANCMIGVKFTPPVIDTRSASLTITYNAIGSPQTVSLTGTGIAPAVVFPTSLSFSDQLVGTTSASQIVRLTNNESTALSITSIAISGTNGSDFAQSNTRGTSVAAGGNCTVGVNFTPAAIGTRSASVTITYNAIGSPQTVPLTGSGIAAGASVSPSTISFTSQYVGTSGLPQSVTLTNTGVISLDITRITASPADFGPLSGCGSSLAAGSSCAIGVFFDPTTGGTRTGTLTITDSAPDSPQTVTLTGTGKDFSVTPTSSGTATVTPGQIASYVLTIAPNGGFNQSVAFACSGAPPQSTCAVSPSSIALNGSAAAQATVTVTTMAASSPVISPSARGRYRPLYPIPELLGLSLVTVLLGWHRGRRPRLAYGLAVLLFLCAGVMMSACGGGISGNSGTPKGTYTLVVSGTFASGSSTLTRNSNLTLVVQ